MEEKKYVSNNALLMAEWHWEKNSDVTPSQLTLGSKMKVWWRCARGHEWQARTAHRNNGSGCPYCSGLYVIKGETDLQTMNPTVAEEWNRKRNGTLIPEDFSASSGKLVWWKCKSGHEWQATINNRSKGKGCPYCANKKLLSGYNDLQSMNPMLAKEWLYEKNNGLTPMDVTASSDKKVWWRCSKGHEWQAVIGSRNRGIGCPVCKSERNTSLPEYILIYYLEKCGLEAIHSHKNQGYELDVYIPSKQIAIEYDGYYWHRDKTRKDIEKNLRCIRDGIKLFRIREGLPPLNDSSVDYVIQKDQKDLSRILEMLLFEVCGIKVDVDLKRDIIAIENLREHTEKANSILRSNPEIACEWNYEKNGNLQPEYFLANSHKGVWWKCSKGHEWQATIDSRSRGNGCPYCSGRYAVKGENDLQTMNPTLAKEWNYIKNDANMPDMFTANSGEKVWWKCSEGHEWQASIHSRNSGVGCPYCAGKKVLEGYNDLQTLNPALSKEWNYEKNSDSPNSFTVNSGKKVWWKCKEGHEWQATIASRNRGHSCPYCSSRYAIKGQNDLQTVIPTLAQEWNYEKNEGLTPEDVRPKSNKKVWWICGACGHEWPAIIGNRSRGSGCPKCSKKKK